METNNESALAVNQHTGEILAYSAGTSAFDMPEQQGIIYVTGHARQYRADCKAGVFKIGDSDFKGKSLQLEILAYRQFEGELFSYPFQSWLEVVFVDSDNVLGLMLLKGASIDNFVELWTKCTIEKKPIGSLIITATMDKRTGKNGDYYVVSFSAKPNDKKRVAELQHFAQSTILPSRLAELALG